jgi:hypothetical protein
MSVVVICYQYHHTVFDPQQKGKTGYITVSGDLMGRGLSQLRVAESHHFDEE